MQKMTSEFLFFWERTPSPPTGMYLVKLMLGACVNGEVWARLVEHVWISYYKGLAMSAKEWPLSGCSWQQNKINCWKPFLIFYFLQLSNCPGRCMSSAHHRQPKPVMQEVPEWLPDERTARGTYLFSHFISVSKPARKKTKTTGGKESQISGYGVLCWQ